MISNSQDIHNTPFPNIKHRYNSLNPARIAIQRIVYLMKGYGFNTVYSPSLEIANVLDNKRVTWNREDLDNKNNSNYPIFAYNRTNIIPSNDISGMRSFNVFGPSGSIGIYSHGEFTLRFAAIFNSMELLEDFETQYLVCGMNSNNLQIGCSLPPIGILSDLSSENRRFLLDMYWSNLSDIITNRNGSHYDFTLSGSVKVLCPYFIISDKDTVRCLSSAVLNFYWDLEMENKESTWSYTKDNNGNLTIIGKIESTGKEVIFKS